MNMFLKVFLIASPFFLFIFGCGDNDRINKNNLSETLTAFADKHDAIILEGDSTLFTPSYSEKILTNKVAFDSTIEAAAKNENGWTLLLRVKSVKDTNIYAAVNVTHKQYEKMLKQNCSDIFVAADINKLTKEEGFARFIDDPDNDTLSVGYDIFLQGDCFVYQDKYEGLRNLNGMD